MARPWTDWEWGDLAAEAQTGIRGQGAVVEANRRLFEVQGRLLTAIQASSDSADNFAQQSQKLNASMRGYTIAMFVLAIVQIALTF